jgi:endoglucanase
MSRKFSSVFLLVIGLLAGLLIVPARAELPLASVHYFNSYQSPTNWGGWGSAIYQGNGASVANIANTVPVTNINGVAAMVLDAINPPGAYWNVLFKVSGNPLNWLRTGANPALHLRLNWSAIPTNGAWNMTVVILGGTTTASVPLNDYVNASTNSWQDIYIPGSEFLLSQPALDLTHVWQVALQAAGNYRDHCTLNIAAMDVVPSTVQTNYTEFAKVDQLGYPPLETSKIGLVSWEPGAITTPPTMFQIVNTAGSQVVLTGPVTQFIQPDIWQASGWNLDGDVNYQADFGALQSPGTYIMQLPELGVSSPPFVIATNVYQKLFRDTLRFFYFSRATYPIVNPYAEGTTRAAVHPETTNATYNYNPADGHFNFGTNTNRDVHGCWFDAGDTHVDVPDTAIACWFLLETARDFGSNVPPYGLDLPESTNGPSDLVPLIYNALDWLERMQNADGSVNHYIMGNPNTAAQVQQVSDISSFATACAAGTFAKAYTVLGPWLTPAQSADLLSRAQLSWSWLQNNPNMVQPRLPLQNGVDPGADDTSWGGTNFDSQCRAYAAVELFAATGQAVYNNFFVSQFNQNGGSPLNGSVFGANTTGYGSDNVITYLNNVLNFAFMDYARNNAGNSSIQATLRAAFQHQADTLTNYTALSNYRIPMLYPGHLYWGSSGGVLAPSAMVLARAWQWTGQVAYHAAAIQALHFICGRNPVNRIFASGYGDYQHGSDFYSQFWTNLLQQPPGYIGANIDVSGSAVPDVTNPWKRFIDTQDADMTEPGVYWNSAVAWLAGYVANDSTPPTLQVIPAGGQLSITWSVRSATYNLYQTTNLLSTSAWVVVTNSAVQSNNLCTVNLAPGATATYYRLKAQ